VCTRIHRGRVFLACITLIALAAVAAGSPAYAKARTVRVGVYQNEPKVFMDDAGKASGIFIDILEGMAKEEDWTLVYVPDTWDEDLKALEAGRIDLMPDVAYSPERDMEYDFHRTPVIESWSYVYSAPGPRIERISQLEGKRVAVLKGSIQETVFKQMMSGFGFDVVIIEADSLSGAFDLAASGSADAAIANYLFGDYFYQDYGLVKTSIVFNPVPLFYATGRGRNADLLVAVDRHLDTWIKEPGSIYYRTISRYTAGETGSPLAPYVFWTIGTIGGLLVVAGGVILLLRWQVGTKTRDLVEANEAVRKAEETLRLALEAAEEGIWDWCPKTGAVIWSARSYSMFGYEPDEFPMTVDTWTGLVHPDDADAALGEVLRRIGTGDRSFSIEYRLRTKAGDWLWTASRGKAVALDDEGNVERVVGTHTDITARRLSELELAQHRSHLEESVEARTRELADANESLTRVNRDLAEATAAKSRFFAKMSHELRTPLNSIIGFSGILYGGMAGPLSDEQKYQIGMVHGSGKQLLELVNDILDLSRVEAGKAEVRLESLDPWEVTTEVAEVMRPLAAEKGLELHAETSEPANMIESDREKLRQILTNLVGNAVKFTDSGVVAIRLERGTDARIALVVSDTGPGIPADDIPLVFDVFHQVEMCDGVRPTGTGLGLAISQEYAHLLGGEVTVASEEGNGSVFTLWLPRRSPRAPRRRA